MSGAMVVRVPGARTDLAGATVRARTGAELHAAGPSTRRDGRAYGTTADALAHGIPEPMPLSKMQRDDAVNQARRRIARYRSLVAASPKSHREPDPSQADRIALLTGAVADLSRALALETSGAVGDLNGSPESVLFAYPADERAES